MKIQKSSAITLVELLIAASLLIVIMTSVFASFRSGLFGYRDIEESIAITQSAARVLERIDVDLRNALAYAKADSRFQGSSQTLAFFSLVDSYTNNGAGRQCALLKYSLDNGRLMRLCRKSKEAFREPSTVTPQEMMVSVSSLRFSYGYRRSAAEPLRFDKEAWDDAKALPPAVKVDLEAGTKTVRHFQRTIYLPVLTYE